MNHELEKILAELKEKLDLLNIRLQEEAPKDARKYSKKCKDIAHLVGEINDLFGEKG